MGLAFSVPGGVKIPSSLVNIFKELKEDLGHSVPLHGNLERWAVQVDNITELFTHISCHLLRNLLFSYFEKGILHM